MTEIYLDFELKFILRSSYIQGSAGSEGDAENSTVNGSGSGTADPVFNIRIRIRVTQNDQIRIRFLLRYVFDVQQKK